MTARHLSSLPAPSKLQPQRALVALALLASLTGCGHSQPEKDYGSSSGSGGPPPSGTSGKGGGATGGSAGAAGSGGKAGGGNADGTFSTNASCRALEKRFDELLPKILNCTVGTTRCDAKFRDRLACSCEIFVATEDFEGVALIQGVITDWDKAGCAKLITCPDTTCETAVSGACVADGDLGVCTTK